MKDEVEMPAGRYYIGDLCYVLRDEVWDEVCRLTISSGTCLEGKFTLSDGRDFVMLGTKWGDGTYNDFMGRRYFVDSGTIGCIKVDDNFEGFEGSVIAKFTEPFRCYKEKAMLVFGHISVNTGDDSDNDDDDEDEDEDY